MGIVGDFTECVVEANAFLRVAEWCNEDAGQMVNGLMYPGVVNAAFACELYIKAIMIHISPMDEAVAGHYLDKLFGRLPTDVQQAIDKRYKTRYNKDIQLVLAESSNAFVQWRYAFENGVSLDVTGIMALAYALKEYISTLVVKK